MSKQYNIHWRRSDYSKLSHLIRKANKKSFGLEVTRPDLAGHIPELMDYKTEKANIKTRQDFNNFINKWNRYLREGSEELIKSERGAVATKFEVHEFQIAQNAENARRRAQRKKLEKTETTIGGEKTGVNRAEMGRVKDNALKDSKKSFKNMSQKEWENAFKNFDKKMNSATRESEKLRHIRNYIKGLIAEGYSQELVDTMTHIPLEDFSKVFYSDEIGTYDFIYDPLELKMKQEELIDLWQPYVDENITHNIDFKSINDEIQREYQNGERIRGQGRVRRKKKI